jgi:hypothetical protein
MKAINFTTKALSQVEHLNAIEEILSFHEFQLLLHVSTLFDKENKSDGGILFVKTYLYLKAKNTKKKEVLIPALKEFSLQKSIKEEAEQIAQLEKTEIFIKKLSELSSMMDGDPAIKNLVDTLSSMNTPSLINPSLN